MGCLCRERSELTYLLGCPLNWRKFETHLSIFWPLDGTRKWVEREIKFSRTFDWLCYVVCNTTRLPNIHCPHNRCEYVFRYFEFDASKQTLEYPISDKVNFNRICEQHIFCLLLGIIQFYSILSFAGRMSAESHKPRSNKNRPKRIYYSTAVLYNLYAANVLLYLHSIQLHAISQWPVTTVFTICKKNKCNKA